VVEHDEETMMAADWLIELGPAAGEHGGHVTAAGTVDEFTKSNAITAQYLRGEKRIDIPSKRRQPRSPNPLVSPSVAVAEPVEMVEPKAKKAAKPRKARQL
jgi:excinuclease ABC subunit A